MLNQLKNGYLNAASFPDLNSTADLETYAHFDEQNIEKGGSHFMQNWHTEFHKLKLQNFKFMSTNKII